VKIHAAGMAPAVVLGDKSSVGGNHRTGLLTGLDLAAAEPRLWKDAHSRVSAG
jgi:hypothetical protein